MWQWNIRKTRRQLRKQLTLDIVKSCLDAPKHSQGILLEWVYTGGCARVRVFDSQTEARLVRKIAGLEEENELLKKENKAIWEDLI